MSLYQRYLNAEIELNEGLIRMDVSIARPEGYVKDPTHRMATMKSFLHRLGNPQKGIPAIHVTGTSGKGSVSASIAGILKEAGLKVGLHISPYLQSATEKIWIDGKYVSVAEFSSLVNWVIPIARPLRSPNTPASIHGMASVAIAFEAFKRNNVDVMVFEAGCGGRYDLTSFMDTDVAVITNVGLDHVVSLGPTIREIAWHKVGIARKNVPLITGATGEALDVIQQEAKSIEAPIEIIQPLSSVTAHNTLLAQTAAKAFARKKGMVISENALHQGPQKLVLPGRFERIDDEATVYLDGAHNKDKLTAAVTYAKSQHPMGRHVAVVGLLGTKANTKTIAPLNGQFDTIIATQPSVYGKQPFPAEETAKLFSAFADHMETQVIVHKSPNDAVSKAIQLSQGGMVLICGSFYLCGEIRNRWYSKEDVVLQQTSWPMLDQV